jgi:CRISPR-associated protein Cas2
VRKLKTYVVISYDISDDRHRAKVCKLLKNYGAHVQYSVFECSLGRRDLQELRRRLAKWVVPEQDSVRFYHLCQADVARIESLGRKRLPAGEKLFYLY